MNKMLTALAVVLVLATSCATTEAGEETMATNEGPTLELGQLAGTWMGEIQSGGTRLRIVFRLDEDGNGFMDSPDQGVKDIPVSKVSTLRGRVTIEVEMARGGFEGDLIGADVLEGEWSQPGVKIPLRLERGVETPEVLRPQEPKPPYPYRVEDVRFDNGAHTLAGTLTLPEGEGPFAAVALVTGSGPQNRDEELMGHKPFLVLADHLTRAGIAVLRYDDRGVGESGGDFPTATTEDLASDALAAHAFLEADDRIDAGKVGLVGHSEGGTIGIFLGARNPQIDFLVLLAPSAVQGRDLLMVQTRQLLEASGAGPEAVELTMDVNRSVYDLVLTESDPTALEAGILAQLERVGLTGDAAAAQVASITSPWYRFFLGYDPQVDAANLTMPVFALFGGKDLQVDAATNEGAMNALGLAALKAQVFPNLNHLFQTATTGLPAEYGTIQETMSPAVLEAVAQWINETAQ